jgi:opacity protein-like surface antigen
MSLDGGVNLAGSLKLSGFLPGSSISLNTGVRFGLETGYAFKLADHFTVALELEIGILYNTLNQATASVGGVTASAAVSGDYCQVPILVNGIFNWEFASHWVAYAGAGAGYNLLILSNNNGNSNGGGGNGGPNTNIGTEGDFAWQVLGGIRYSTGRWDIGAGYKYLATQPSGFKTQSNNAILASFTLHF